MRTDGRTKIAHSLHSLEGEGRLETFADGGTGARTEVELAKLLATGVHAKGADHGAEADDDPGLGGDGFSEGGSKDDVK